MNLKSLLIGIAGGIIFLAGFLIYVTEIKKSTYNSDRIQQEFGK
jgi:hypothetical protein